MTQGEWSAELAHSVGAEVRKHRKRLKMSAERLAGECERLGMRIERSVLANLENQRRNTIGLAEVLVLARALDVAPILLIFPVGDVETVQPLPNESTTPYAAAKWFSGEFQTHKGDFPVDRFDSATYRRYDESLGKLDAYRRHESVVSNTLNVYWDIHDPSPRNSRKPTTPADAARASEALAMYGEILHYQREDMRAKGMVLPALPDELNDIVRQRS